MSIIFNSADIAETMNNGVANVTGADSTITENYSNVVQHGIKIDMSVSEKTISGTPPLTFNSNGTPLIDYTIYGNTIQDGTPTPTSPVAVNGVGTLSNGNYTIPIRTNTITNINLNSVPTTRKIKKIVLTGEENWLGYNLSLSGIGASLTVSNMLSNSRMRGFCTHFSPQYSPSQSSINGITYGAGNNTIYITFSVATATALGITDTSGIKPWLARQYANNTPVTVWYVLATPTSDIVNEPLMKIGGYADSVSYSQSGVTIPTAAGNNILNVQTTPKPSNISITYKGR